MPNILKMIGAPLSVFGIPAELLRLCELTLNHTQSSAMIGKGRNELFDTKQGFGQGDFFNLLLEKMIRAADLNIAGTILCKNVQRQAYADDIDGIYLNTSAVISVFSRLDKEAKQMDIVVNED